MLSPYEQVADELDPQTSRLDDNNSTISIV